MSSMIAAILVALAPPRDSIAEFAGQAVLSGAPSSAIRVEVIAHRDRVAEGCRVGSAQVLGPVLGSGRVTLKLNGLDRAGRACQGWSWAEVRVFAEALATTRPIATGQPLANCVAPVVSELFPGRRYLDLLPAEAVAASPLGSGVTVEVQAVRSPAQIPGRELAVRLRSGDLVIETHGQAVPCSLDAACARLASGKQVSGTYVDGHLEVLLP